MIYWSVHFSLEKKKKKTRILDDDDDDHYKLKEEKAKKFRTKKKIVNRHSKACLVCLSLWMKKKKNVSGINVHQFIAIWNKQTFRKVIFFFRLILFLVKLMNRRRKTNLHTFFVGRWRFFFFLENKFLKNKIHHKHKSKNKSKMNFWWRTPKTKTKIQSCKMKIATTAPNSNDDDSNDSWFEPGFLYSEWWGWVGGRIHFGKPKWRAA